MSTKPFRTNAAYRRHMTAHALETMNDNLRHACENANARAFDFAVPPQQSSVHPSHFFRSLFDESQPIGYETNAAKAAYLSEYREEASTVTHDMTHLLGLRF
jgi:hypothetical protein